ncbi:MAG TPA: TlpA disulfide reductase family protein [Chitinophagales bacterium]|nr:TlpA disulfide reductase family protein [Chitinophagales bacterium]HQD12175.1 TlpA disulfide reductase family protein [Chitinophagales bacterium]
MKKYLIPFVAAILLLTGATACKSFKGYEIQGTLTNAPQAKVYLEDITADMPVILDTATVSGNSFKLKNYAEKGIYRIRIGEDAQKSIYVYLDEKTKLEITADFQQLQQYSVKGNKGSESIQQLIATSEKRFKQLDVKYSAAQTAPAIQKDSLMVVFIKEKNDYVAYIKEFVEKEPNNDVACFALNLLGPMMQEEVAYLVDITDKLYEAEPSSKFIKGWYDSMQQYREALLQQNAGGLALNTEAPNIVLATPNGDTIQLKDLRGKYVLLDFWASWCQPCRMENPNVVAVYQKYKNQGFDVFSVSLDANKEQWVKAIAKDKLVWKNHGCDFGGWQSAPAQRYQVQSIPNTYLIDKNGIIIAKNLRADELEKKLAELFSQPATAAQ